MGQMGIPVARSIAQSTLIRLLIVVAACAFSFSAHAAMIELDFEEAVFANGTVVDDEYESLYGVSIFGVNNRRSYGAGESAAVIFDTGLSNTEDPDLEAPFRYLGAADGEILNPGNVLIIHENPGSCDAAHQLCRNPDDEGRRIAGGFEFSFDNPVTVLSLDYFDIETSENSSNAGSEVRFFDAGGTLISSNFAPNAGGDNGWATLDFQIAGVSSMWVGLRGSGAIDRLAFESSAVPVPPAFALFLTGLAALFGFRSRQARAAAA